MKRPKAIAVILTVSAIMGVTGTAFGQVLKIDYHNAGAVQTLGGPFKEDNRKTSRVFWDEISEDKSEMIAGGVDNTDSLFRQLGESERRKIISDNTPNTVTAYKTIEAEGISKMKVASDLCGVIIEPSDTGKFEIAVVGMKNSGNFSVKTAVKDGVLSVELQGNKDNIYYISNTPGNLVNTVRIQVPSQALEEILVSDACGNTSIADMDIPLYATTINGNVKLIGNILEKDYDMGSVNGTVYLLGKEIKGKVTMDTVNGDVILKGDNIEGRADLECVNGDVKLKGGTVKDAYLSCINGDVKAEADKITGNLEASAMNGDVEVKIEKKPSDLFFQPSIGQNSEVSLPNGWRKGFRIGEGNAKLKISSMNGDVELEVEGY